MKKNITYKNVRFAAEVLKDAARTFEELAKSAEKEIKIGRLMVQHDDGANWDYDTFEEFYSDYRKFGNYAVFRISAAEYWLDLIFNSSGTTIQVDAPSRSQIERVFACFEEKLNESKIPPPLGVIPTVFIGHGGDQAWRELKDHLQDKHGYRIEAYESGARAGHTIRDILEDMVKNSSFALLVMTGEDAQLDNQLRARQNVIHEAGLFQGRLGFSRAILLLERGVEQFSNVAGIQYIPFNKGNIKECFGEVLATLRREFKSD